VVSYGAGTVLVSNKLFGGVAFFHASTQTLFMRFSPLRSFESKKELFWLGNAKYINEFD
jgi:hypothetical protein